MATINLTIPDALEDWLEAQAKAAGHADPGAYLEALIRQDQERATRIAAMQRRVTEGLESGLGNRSMQELREAPQARIASACPPEDWTSSSQSEETQEARGGWPPLGPHHYFGG